jgi:hypothetical protein
LTAIGNKIHVQQITVCHQFRLVSKVVLWEDVYVSKESNVYTYTEDGGSSLVTICNITRQEKEGAVKDIIYQDGCLLGRSGV